MGPMYFATNGAEAAYICYDAAVKKKAQHFSSLWWENQSSKNRVFPRANRKNWSIYGKFELQSFELHRCFCDFLKNFAGTAKFSENSNKKSLNYRECTTFKVYFDMGSFI